MRKLAFCICENKDADQFRIDGEADQRLCFSYMDSKSLYFLNWKFQASNHLLWLCSLVCVGLGRKPSRPVFSERGSINLPAPNQHYNRHVVFSQGIDQTIFRLVLQSILKLLISKQGSDCKYYKSLVLIQSGFLVMEKWLHIHRLINEMFSLRL